MELIPAVFLVILSISALLNGFFAFVLIRKRRKKEPQPTLSAEQLLHDLTRGPALVRVEVIDAKNLMLRRPR